MSELQSIDDLLVRHPFFKGMRPQDTAFLAGCGRNVVFQPNEEIFREGGPADGFYVIRHGKVAIETFAPERGPIRIETIGDGDVLGWSWLFPPYKWAFDARAIDLTRAVALDGGCLRAKCDEDHTLGYEMVKRFAAVMMDRLTAARVRLLDLYGDGNIS